MDAHPYQCSNSFSQPPRRTTLSQLLCVLTMATKSQQQKEQNAALSSLKMTTAIDALNHAKEAVGMTPAKTTFTSASVLLTTIRVGFLPVHLCRLLADDYTGFNDQ